MDTPRQHLLRSQSQLSRRKVRFGNGFSDENNTTTNKSNQNILDKGLNVSLFEGRVDQQLICAICSRVFVQPEVSSCQHVFCSSCLHDSVGQSCPTCSLPLDRTPANQPPVNLRLKLLDLVIRCENKCGEVMPLGKLPRHVSDNCPNTPVPCPHSKRGGTGGCQIKVKRCQLLEHIKECDWRHVHCEACGERTVFNHLVFHQKKSRCVENRIKNQLVQAIKCTHQEALRHRKTLEHQRVKIESNQRRNELDHVRRLQSMKTPRRQGSWHPHNHNQQQQQQQQQHPFYDESPLSSYSFNDYSNNSSKNSSFSDNYHTDNHKQRQTHLNNHKRLPANKPSDQNGDHNDTATKNNDSNRYNNQQQIKDVSAKGQGPVSNVTSGAINNTDTQPNVNVFFTSTDPVDDESDKANGTLSLPPSREHHHGHQLLPDTQFFCKKCNKRTRESCNNPSSCRWHAGPIIELFGGTCYTCGRLDYQHGCMIGFHEK